MYMTYRYTFYLMVCITSCQICMQVITYNCRLADTLSSYITKYSWPHYKQLHLNMHIVCVTAACMP